eukprot:CAMPEP_0204584596 /NCGR_PEP_ID=MMETSP0661-20131031/46429_1 /ASSEMBLY_ACC=CAM_ASM_000606 /TAXON_ID=109239 /ORGANISM="Alexandrium margalefi, Strain AMGDE01CS-322" /LENGTH=103 /DNA_ID=CAMNT_0051594061 /DNA_START=87 /DNA_END=398 /DNA_ORIENTATION=-
MTPRSMACRAKMPEACPSPQTPAHTKPPHELLQILGALDEASVADPAAFSVVLPVGLLVLLEVRPLGPQEDDVHPPYPRAKLDLLHGEERVLLNDAAGKELGL